MTLLGCEGLPEEGAGEQKRRAEAEGHVDGSGEAVHTVAPDFPQE